MKLALNAESKVAFVGRVREGVGTDRRSLLSGDVNLDRQKLPRPKSLEWSTIFWSQIEGGDGCALSNAFLQNELAPSGPGRIFGHETRKKPDDYQLANSQGFQARDRDEKSEGYTPVPATGSALVIEEDKGSQVSQPVDPFPKRESQFPHEPIVARGTEQ